MKKCWIYNYLIVKNTIIWFIFCFKQISRCKPIALY